MATKSPDDLQATAAPPTASRSVVAWVFGGALLLIFGVLFSFLLLFLVPILLIGGAIFWFFRVFLPSQVTGSIQCNVEPQRLTAAESVRGTMRFTPRREVRVNGVRCTVTCKERCVSGSGSNRQTHLHEVFRHTEQLSEARTLRVAMPESFEFAVPLPADAPLSLKFGNNELTWNVELRIDIPKWPDWVKEFPLTIVPSATAAATAALVLGESASHGAPADSAGRSAPLGGASDDTWFDEVARQIIQSRHDSSRMQLVLDAVRDHRFTIRVDIDQRLSDPPGSAPLERGSWMLAHYRPQDLALCLVWPPGQPPPAANTYDWCCPAQILAFDDPLDRLVMRVLPSAA